MQPVYDVLLEGNTQTQHTLVSSKYPWCTVLQ
jgi:hypothetical protein